MSNSVAAVVVTFNRKQLLVNCVTALLNQTRRLDAIYIFDNASTDGTFEHLKESGLFGDPRLVYLGQEVNLGGAGGFRRGMERAYRDGHDWLWIMDDDAEPKLEALAELVPYLDAENACALSSFKVDAAGDVQFPHMGKIAWRLKSSLVRPICGADYQGKPSIDIEFSSFVGLLVSRQTIEKIGFPKAEFFIHADDVEYCVRMKAAGKIKLVPKSVIVHNSPREISERKQWLIFSGYTKNFRSACFMYYVVRNSTWVVKQYAPGGLLRAAAWAAVQFAKHVLVTTVFERDARGLRIYVLFRAYWDGLQGRFDNSLPLRVMARAKSK